MLESIIGFFSGIISGMGVGGGMLLIPALRMFFDISQQGAQSINLFSFIPSAVCATFIHIKNKKTDFHVAWPMIVVGVPFSLLGAYICTQVSSRILSIMFGIFILIFGIREVISGFKDAKEEKSTNG